jgi:dephospho-CoA kinase
MKAIVITGNIGCGKSYISNQLWNQREKFDVEPWMSINMDHETFAHVYDHGRRFLINNFLTTNKRMISDLVFSNPLALAELNNHFAPAVREMFWYWVNYPGDGPVIIEFPLLYECFTTPAERDMIYDACTVVAVYAEDDVRYKRAMARDNKTLEQIQRVERAQMSQTEKCKLADLVVVNDPSKIDTTQLVLDLIEELNGRTDKSRPGILWPDRR